MSKLIRARNTLRKNGKKGFTLIELIVVIVIIAILIAALTPAILGVIDRANVAADESDLRTVMIAAQAAADFRTNTPPTNVAITQQMSSGNLPSVTATLYFDGALCVGARCVTGRSKTPANVWIGDIGATAGSEVWAGQTS